MSSLASLLLVSLSLGLNNFAASIGIGVSGIDAKTRVRTALVFGLFEAFMPLVGLLIGQGLAGFIGQIGHDVSAGLLVLTGVYILWQARKGNRDADTKAEENHPFHFGRLALTGFVLSLDNLVVGFALSLSHVPFLLAALVIALVSVVLSLVGLEVGQHLGKRFEEWSEVISGGMLVLVGVAIGLEREEGKTQCDPSFNDLFSFVAGDFTVLLLFPTVLLTLVAHLSIMREGKKALFARLV